MRVVPRGTSGISWNITIASRPSQCSVVQANPPLSAKHMARFLGLRLQTTPARRPDQGEGVLKSLGKSQLCAAVKERKERMTTREMNGTDVKVGVFVRARHLRVSSSEACLFGMGDNINSIAMAEADKEM